MTFVLSERRRGHAQGDQEQREESSDAHTHLRSFGRSEKGTSEQTGDGGASRRGGGREARARWRQGPRPDRTTSGFVPRKRGRTDRDAEPWEARAALASPP